MRYLFFAFTTFLSGHLCAAEQQKKQFRFIIHNKYENPVVVKYGSHGTIINNGSSTLVGPLTMCSIETAGFMPVNNLHIKSSSMVFIEEKKNNAIAITQNNQLLATLNPLPPRIQPQSKLKPWPFNDALYYPCMHQ